MYAHLSVLFLLFLIAYYNYCCTTSGMSEFILVTLRWYHGGISDLRRGESLYIGGKITDFLDVNVDKISIIKLRNYHK